MGISFSSPGADALNESMETLLMRSSISFSSDNTKSITRSLSFNGRDSEPAIFKAFGSGKLIVEGCLSFKGSEMETNISIKGPTSEGETSSQSFPKSRFRQLKEKRPESPVTEAASPKHEAAVKLQKVYKSFRTRRQLADCAVLVEQRWWKLLDFALLKRSSVSFFDIEKPESAISRWSRAKMRVAMVAKGLSKDEKAQKLALQHWLEAIDPRHRYGHNLHFYYDNWLNCDSNQPFFYWLDIGEGKEVNLDEQCPRWKLQHQCIKYLGPKEREAYEVIVEDGKFYYKRDRKPLDTTEGPKDTKWIFVLSTLKKLYVGQKKKGFFQHSSFLAGGATSAAGRLVVENGILKAVWPHSGHYQPTKENFQEFVSFLKENKVDLTDVRESPAEDDEESYSGPRSNTSLASSHSEEDLTARDFSSRHGAEVETSSHASNGFNRSDAIAKSTIASAATEGVSFGSSPAEPKLDGSQMSERSFSLEQCQNKQGLTKEQVAIEEESDGRTPCTSATKRINSLERSLGHGYSSSTAPLLDDEVADEESAPQQPYNFRKRNLFVEEHEEDGEASVPQELILHRINSKKKLKSLQLGKQLSCKWTTGAGPRIGFVRDYPSELQFRALEQVNLSPKATGSPRCLKSPGPKTLEVPSLEKVLQNNNRNPLVIGRGA